VERQNSASGHSALRVSGSKRFSLKKVSSINSGQVGFRSAFGAGISKELVPGSLPAIAWSDSDWQAGNLGAGANKSHSLLWVIFIYPRGIIE